MVKQGKQASQAIIAWIESRMAWKNAVNSIQREENAQGISFNSHSN